MIILHHRFLFTCINYLHKVIETSSQKSILFINRKKGSDQQRSRRKQQSNRRIRLWKEITYPHKQKWSLKDQVITILLGKQAFILLTYMSRNKIKLLQQTIFLIKIIMCRQVTICYLFLFFRSKVLTSKSYVLSSIFVFCYLVCMSVSPLLCISKTVLLV